MVTREVNKVVFITLMTISDL